MYDWNFIRSVEAIAFRLENTLKKFYPSTQVKRSHWPTFSTIEAITDHHTGGTSEVGIELSLSLPVQDPDYQNEIIDRMVDAISDEASCYVLPGYPDTLSEFFDIDDNTVKIPQSINTWRSFVPLDDQDADEPDKNLADQTQTPDDTIKSIIEKIPNSTYQPPKNFDPNNWDLEEVSPLKLFGYTVGANGLSEKERREFLDAFLKVAIPHFLNPKYISEWGDAGSSQRLHKTMRHISANIQRTQRNDAVRYVRAIADWEADLNWLQSKIGTLNDLDDEIPF